MNYILKHKCARGLIFQSKVALMTWKMFKVITYTASCNNVAVFDFKNFDVHVEIKHGKMFFSMISFTLFSPQLILVND